MRVPLSLGAVLVSSLAATVALVACGARSELDALLGPVAQADAGVDAAEDVAADVPEDVPEDVPPDVTPECFGPEVTWIYVVTDADELLAFKPQSNSFESKGYLLCPAGQATPFSMAVARDGVAHVIYNDGRMYRVSVFDASCEETPYIPSNPGEPFNLFGMGHAADPDGGETLYVADITFSDPSLGLAILDTETYQLSFIGPFSENPGNAIELTPTGSSGPLYGYFLNNNPPGGTLVQIDTNTADILESTFVNAGNGSNSLAVAWWGGSFYIFTGVDGDPTVVTRFDPVTQATDVVATLPEHVVGAGVSTCAPDFPE